MKLKKLKVMIITTAIAVIISACGSSKDGEEKGTVETVESTAENVESTVAEENSSETSSEALLSVPEVKDGVKRPGDDCIEVYFEWTPVDGADGYEVSSQGKYYSDEEFNQPEITETNDPFYVASAQDDFDFLIKVRAFKGTGKDRVYSDWSSEAAGFTYEDSEIAETVDDVVSAESYDEIIDTISDGLKNGFNEDEDSPYGISTCFFMNNPEYEILGYLKKDLDGDGTEELILGENAADGSGPNEGWDSIIYDLYTMKNGKVVHVFDGWERNRYYLCDDGSIANEGSSGAAYSSWAYYNYSDGKLNIIESVFTDDDEKAQGYWFHSDKEPYEDESNPITEDEGKKLLEKHRYQKLDFTPF